jgi:hypothetical protein
VAAEDLVFLDESGVTTSMTRLYGRAPKGERGREAVPQGRWQVMTRLGALSSTARQAALTIAWATDADVLATFVVDVLGTHTAGRPSRGAGQLEGPQGRTSAGRDRGLRVSAGVSAALLARPEPAGAGWVEGEDALAGADGTSLGAVGRRRGRSAAQHHQPRCPGLLPPLRRCPTVTEILL